MLLFLGGGGREGDKDVAHLSRTAVFKVASLQAGNEEEEWVAGEGRA